MLYFLAIFLIICVQIANGERPLFPYADEASAIEDFRRFMPYAYAVNCNSTWLKQKFPRGSVFEDLHPTTFVKGMYDDKGASAIVVYNDYLKSIIISFRPTITKQQIFEDLKLWKSNPFSLFPDTILNYFKSLVFSSKEIAHRASDELQRIADELNPGNSSKFTLPPNAFLHRGFQNLYNTFRNDTLILTAMLAKQFPDYRIVYTGHSLGAAMAQIAAVDFSMQTAMSERIWLFSFASPRVGNRVWAEFVNQQEFARMGQVHRLVRFGDPIPNLPPQFFGYKHPYTAHIVWNDLKITKCPEQKSIFSGALLSGGECLHNWPHPFKLNMNLHPPRMYMSYLGLQFNCSRWIDET